ncbi:hypothetical protein V6Z12_A08G065300 [Gossypium hirsutum]
MVSMLLLFPMDSVLSFSLPLLNRFSIKEFKIFKIIHPFSRRSSISPKLSFLSLPIKCSQRTRTQNGIERPSD